MCGDERVGPLGTWDWNANKAAWALDHCAKGTVPSAQPSAARVEKVLLRTKAAAECKQLISEHPSWRAELQQTPSVRQSDDRLGPPPPPPPPYQGGRAAGEKAPCWLGSARSALQCYSELSLYIVILYEVCPIMPIPCHVYILVVVMRIPERSQRTRAARDGAQTRT